jgi:uncharacterized membrane protein YphA (DoxX/SURF4 family)
MDHRVQRVYWTLRFIYGLVPIVAGLDKFFNLLTNWQDYLSPGIAAALPVSPAMFMAVVGVIEIVVGMAVLTRFTRLGAYVAAAWLTAIALNLLLLGRYDIAVRDLVMAAAAFCLGQLEEVHEASAVGARQPAHSLP